MRILGSLFKGLILAAIFALIPISAFSAQKIIPGSQCKTLKQKVIYLDQSFTCIKSGKKLLWSSGVAIVKPKKTLADVVTPTPVPTPVVKEIPKPEIIKVDFSKAFSTDSGYYTDFAGPCANDPNATGQLAEIQAYFMGFNKCAGQIRINKYSLGNAKPIAQYSAASEFADLSLCKLVTPVNGRSNMGYTMAEASRNAYEVLHKFPSPRMVIQLVPIYTADTAQPVNSPIADYGAYLNFVKEWLEYSSDFSSNVVVRVPKEYINVKVNLAEVNLFHEDRFDSPSHVAFGKLLVAAADPVIDFSGANVAIVVAPAGTSASIFSQSGIGSLQTNEGVVSMATTEYAHLAASPLSSKFSVLGHPFWWIHEMFHAGIGFDDHYGDSLQNINTEYGMGFLTLMTPWGGDLTTWEKWRMGFMEDSQIQCKLGTATSTHLIAPSTVRTTSSKAIIIPISSTRVLVVETLRPAGLYYKLPLKSQGALVYEVDLLKTDHGMGMKLSLPIGRAIDNYPFFMASYPLKQGESTISNGYKISIVESGSFGDVVKIEKA
ncbi:MAG: hypothetical protein F2843_01110 [Actinobacteria bacterium]|uniref:Unannotated protein n=1 Tax=freshwater metagenome TaxID=449393 RepID=A0A6J7ITF7_9ZZZZ|nr:hypothetical protein [Actinomycetota bacterium]